METPTHKPHQDYYLGEDEIPIDEVIEKLIVKYGGDFEVLKEYFQKILTEELLESFNEFIAIQCADGTWNYDPYMQGMANGMLFMKSLVDDEQPMYLEAPAVWLKDIEDNSPPTAAEEGFTDVVEETLSDPFAVAAELRKGKIAMRKEGSKMRRRRFARRRVTAMNESGAVNLLEEALYDYFENMDRDDFEITSFEHAGLMTGDKGLVLTVGDDHFQISVVQARPRY